MKKILLANRPSLAKRGQYTFEDDGVTNAGVYSSFNKFIKKDLYTFSENESMNQTIVNAGTYHFSSDSFLRINRLRIDNTGQGKDKKNVSVKIWMWVQRKSDFTAEYVSSNNIGTRQEIWYKNYGDESEGWSPGTIINNSKLLENFRERLNFACETYPFLKNRADYLIRNIQQPNINSICWRIIIFDIWAKKYGVI